MDNVLKLVQTAFFIGFLMTSPALAADLQVLHAFNGADGAWSRGSLTLGGSTLYGRTSLGGVANRGTIFSIGTDGTGFASLYSFSDGGSNGTGNMPHHNAMTLVGSTLYGAALYGGNENNPQPASSPGPTPPPSYPKEGNGTAFSIQTDGTGYTVLHAFNGPTADGALAHSPFTLIGSTAYGMTSNGGANNDGSLYSFALSDPAGTYVVEKNFQASTGKEPHGMVIADSTGSKLLGMTRKGGANDVGVIFDFDPVTDSYSVLHEFESVATNGATNDHGFLTRINQTVFGLTSGGGAYGEGVLFSMTEAGEDFSLLHSFGDGSDGEEPYGSLTLLNNTFYGTTSRGGANGVGTIFSIQTDGSGYSLLASFDTATTGGLPEDFLTANASGTMLYGLTQNGGGYDTAGNLYYGTVFAIAIPEPSVAVMLILAAFGGIVARVRNFRQTERSRVI